MAGACTSRSSNSDTTGVVGWEGEQVQYDFAYKDGVPEGEWVVYDADGKPAVVLYFENGICKRVSTRWIKDADKAQASSAR